MLQASIEITFKKIAGQEVTPKMVGFSLKHATNKTIKKLCQEIKKYFKDKNIEIETEFELITKEEETA
jgi:hypothetical protein